MEGKFLDEELSEEALRKEEEEIAKILGDDDDVPSDLIYTDEGNYSKAKRKKPFNPVF